MTGGPSITHQWVKMKKQSKLETMRSTFQTMAILRYEVDCRLVGLSGKACLTSGMQLVVVETN